MAIYKFSNVGGFGTYQRYNNFLAGNPVFVAGDFESIATANGTGSSATITFSSIPSTYTHLQVRAILRATSGSGGWPTGLNSFAINGDTTNSNYWNHALVANGATVSAGSANDRITNFFYYPGNAALASTHAVYVMDILDYKNTNKLKTLRVLGGGDFNGSGNIYFTSMLWNNTAAINSLSFTVDPTFGVNWGTTTSFALYGIKE